MIYIDGNGILRHSDDALMHYGVKGMRWGLRRYQNKDGSLTEYGRRRLRFENARLSAKDLKMTVREQRIQSKKSKKNKPKYDRALKRLARIRSKFKYFKDKAMSDLSPEEIELGKLEYMRNPHRYTDWDFQLETDLFTFIDW